MALPSNQAKDDELKSISEEAKNLDLDEDKKPEEIDEDLHTEDDDKDPDEIKKEEPKKEEDDTDWQKRYNDSTREAQNLVSKNTKVLDAVDKASEIPDPTEDDMKRLYSDWDVMTSVEQTLAKESQKSKMQFSIIKKATDEVKAHDKRMQEAHDFAEDPSSIQKYPALEGKSNEFRKFCNKDGRQSLSLPDLADWFIKSLKNEAPKKQNLMPTGTGGDKKSNGDGIIRDPDKARILRQTDFREYQRMSKAGKIKISI